MNEKTSHEERQLSSSQTDSEERATVDRDSAAYRYVKRHDYAPDAFAERGEITPFNGIRVIDEFGSGVEEFENFPAMNQSDWTIKYDSAARLTDGTVLYEGTR